MYAVIRQYSGPGAPEFITLLEQRLDEVEKVIRGVEGVVSYSLSRTAEGGITVTVCRDKAAADATTRAAADWVRANVTMALNPPTIAEGDVLLRF